MPGIHRLISIARRAWLRSQYSPRKIRPGGTIGADVREEQVDGNGYYAARVNGGRILTNTADVIYAISNHTAIEEVSWHTKHRDFRFASDIFRLCGEPVPCPPARIKEPILSLLAGGGGDNYFHWLFDCLPKIKIAEMIFGECPANMKYLVHDLKYPFQLQTLKELGITESQCISSTMFPHVESGSEVIISKSRSRSAKKGRAEWITGFLRTSFHHLFAPASANKLIYISRGDRTGGSRHIVNEQELINSLSQYGVEVVRLTELTFRRQVELFSAANLIIAPHGAGLANLAFCRPKTVVVEIFGCGYEPVLYQHISEQRGLQYHKEICPLAADAQGANVHAMHASMLATDQIAMRLNDLVRQISDRN